ncbi:MAG: hypothetical protein AAGG56_10975 [Pseudomonadota bacterium]
MSLFETTALAASGVAPDTALAKVLESRAGIFEMTDLTEMAVLRPREPGSWPHALRAALAARIARLNDEEALAQRYSAEKGEFAALADPKNDGVTEGYGAVISFMDKVAARTREVAAADISALQAAGVSDADIVRLAELNAFLAYQLRVIAGLRLIGGTG